MLNIKRTKEVFGYEVSLERKRRTADDVASTNGILPKELEVIDNCPSCNTERVIKLRQSRKNKICSKCFHNLPETIEAKRNQKKEKSEEHRQKMRDNHWSKKGVESAFKGKKHSKEAKELLRNKATDGFAKLNNEERLQHRIKSSLQKGRTLEEFAGFTTPENTRLRQSAEGKAWTYDVLAKANFTCDKCSVRGGNLQAHHLNAFNAYPDQRFDVNNGVCLCKDCHDAFHSKFGKGHNSREQYEDFKMAFK